MNGCVPDVRFERTSVIGATGLGGIAAPLAHKGTLNGEFFGACAKERLAPALKEGDTLILDNLSSHKVRGALQPLCGKGINVAFLPPYPQDFNPIEQAWPKMKAVLRRLKARTAGALLSAVAEALDAIAQDGIKGWIAHCGYGL